MSAMLSHTGFFLRDLGLMLLSMVPLVENKVTLVMAAALNVKWYTAYFCTSVGCLLPAPILLGRGTIAIQKLRRYRPIDTMMCRVDAFVQRHPHFFEQNAYRSLLLIIAIPFTGIGVWAGCVLCNMIGLEKKRSLKTIALATAISGMITTLTSYGIIVGIRSLWKLF